MSQDWVSDLYTTGTVGDTTLSNMELMFATLRSSFSGSSAPSNAVDGNLWYDTDTDLLKAYRNAAWAGVLVGSASFKMWVYLNAAEDGWAIDSSTATDRVLSLKGGSTYLAGGANHGTWTISGISVPNHSSHTHTISHTHYLATFSGTNREVSSAGTVQVYSNKLTEALSEGGGYSTTYCYYYTGGPSAGSSGNESATLTHSPTHSGAWRIAAATGTLQYPNVAG